MAATAIGKTNLIDDKMVPYKTKVVEFERNGGPSYRVFGIVTVFADKVKEIYKRSGLYDRVLSSQITLDDAEKRTVNFIKEWTVKDKNPLAGNSISQDRRFLYKYMPKIINQLHYRNIDVSSIKELQNRW